MRRRKKRIERWWLGLEVVGEGDAVVGLGSSWQCERKAWDKKEKIKEKKGKKYQFHENHILPNTIQILNTKTIQSSPKLIWTVNVS